MRGQAERSGVFLQEAVEGGCGAVGVLGGEDLPQQYGGCAHPGDIAGGEVDGVGLAVCAEHVGDVGRVGAVDSESVDQGSGPSSRGQHGVPGGPVVAVGEHVWNVTHLAEF